jgi:hypothetical protein
MSTTPSVDVVAEADRLVRGLAAQEVVGRLVGGLAIATHRHGESPRSLDRSYGDIDIVVPAGSSARVASALDGLGYEANKRFNALHGDRRMMFHDRSHGRQLDVIVGIFAMCHSLDLSSRLDTGSTTLTPADLLLTKLQVVEINHKDLLDVVTLLHHHELADEAPPAADVVDLGRVGEVCGQSWGWCTTVGDNLPRVATTAAELLPAGAAEVVAAKAELVATRLAECPKSLRWKARARVGRRVTWYELPEEVGGTAHG